MDQAGQSGAQGVLRLSHIPVSGGDDLESLLAQTAFGLQNRFQPVEVFVRTEALLLVRPILPNAVKDIENDSGIFKNVGPERELQPMSRQVMNPQVGLAVVATAPETVLRAVVPGRQAGGSETGIPAEAIGGPSAAVRFLPCESGSQIVLELASGKL